MAGMTMKEKVETAVRELGLGETGQKLTEKEIVAKFMGQYNAGYDSDITTFEEDDVTESSDQKTYPRGVLLRPYQATVEDDVSSQADYGVKVDTNGNDASLGVISQPNSPISEVSVFSLSSNNSGPTIAQANDRRSSLAPVFPPSPCRTPAKVHFTRPIVLQHRSSEAVSPAIPLRPTLPARSSTERGSLPIDHEQDRLFTLDGEPTKRLALGLRGFASLIISQHGPSDSLVVTPNMLHKFYARYICAPESLPFNRMFEGHSRDMLRNLEFLYQDLSCEYHLVQYKPKERPSIPALTPIGFERWMTLLIMAFPDREAARLNKVMADSPDDAEGHSRDEKTQKLPSQMPRYLFPARGHDKICSLVRDCFASWEGSNMTPSSSPSQLSSVPLRPHRQQSDTTRPNSRTGRLPLPSPTTIEVPRQRRQESHDPRSTSTYYRNKSTHMEPSRPQPRGKVYRSNSARSPHRHRDVSTPSRPSGKYRRQPSPRPSKRYRNHSSRNSSHDRSLSRSRDRSSRRYSRGEDPYRVSHGRESRESRESRDSTDSVSRGGRSQRIR